MSYNIGSGFDSQRWYEATLDRRTREALEERIAEYGQAHENDSNAALLDQLRDTKGRNGGRKMRTILVDDELWMLEQFAEECAELPEIEIVGNFTFAEDALEFAKANLVEFALRSPQRCA